METFFGASRVVEKYLGDKLLYKYDTGGGEEIIYEDRCISSNIPFTHDLLDYYIHTSSDVFNRSGHTGTTEYNNRIFLGDNNYKFLQVIIDTAGSADSPILYAEDKDGKLTTIGVANYLSSKVFAIPVTNLKAILVRNKLSFVNANHIAKINSFSIRGVYETENLGAIETVFTDTNVRAFIKDKTTVMDSRPIYQLHLDGIKYFGYTGTNPLSTSLTTSHHYFYSKPITNLNGIQYLRNVEYFSIASGSSTQARPSEIDIRHMTKLTSLNHSFRLCKSNTIKFPTELNEAEIMYQCVASTSATVFEIPAKIPKVVQGLTFNNLDVSGKKIIYYADDSITSKNQIKWHNSSGVPEYTKATLDYSRLINLTD